MFDRNICVEQVHYQTKVQLRYIHVFIIYQKGINLTDLNLNRSDSKIEFKLKTQTKNPQPIFMW